jgi:hypothetical protein
MITFYNRSICSIVALCVAIFLFAACGDVFFGEEHLCNAKGYSYRYKDGIRAEENIPETVDFSIVTFRYRKHFKFNANGLFPEHNNPEFFRTRTEATHGGGFPLLQDRTREGQDHDLACVEQRKLRRTGLSPPMDSAEGVTRLGHVHVHRNLPEKIASLKYRNLPQTTDFYGRGYTPRKGGLA